MLHFCLIYFMFFFIASIIFCNSHSGPATPTGGCLSPCLCPHSSPAPSPSQGSADLLLLSIFLYRSYHFSHREGTSRASQVKLKVWRRACVGFWSQSRSETEMNLVTFFGKWFTVPTDINRHNMQNTAIPKVFLETSPVHQIFHQMIYNMRQPWIATGLSCFYGSISAILSRKRWKMINRTNVPME